MNSQNTIPNLLLGCLILIAVVSPFNFIQGQSVDSLQQIINSESDDSLRVVAMISYAKLVELNESESAFMILNDAEALASGQENKMLLVRVYNEKAFLFQKLAKYAESLEQLYKAKRITDLLPKESYDKDMAVSYLRLMNGIGILNYRMEQHEKAIVCFQEGLNFLLEQDSIFSEDTRHRYLFYFYNNMGGNYLKIEEFPRAQYYLEQGIRLIDLENNTREYANVLNNLSIASREMGDLLKASELADESMEICLKNDFKLELASIYNNKGSCCKKNNDLPHAADNFQKAFELSRKNGFGSSGTVALTNLTDTYFSMRQFELSSKYSMLLLQWRDSLRNKEEIRRFAEIETREKFDKQLFENKLEQQRTEADQSRREWIYIIISIVSVLGLSIFILFAQLRSARYKKNKLETEKQKLLAENLTLEKKKLEDELEIRNKELTTNVMYMVRKNELLTKLTQKLKRVKYLFKKENHAVIDTLIADLKSTTKDEVWQEFELRFQQVHNSFYDRLNERFPTLSPNEKRLSAFLRLNMSTKEISMVTNQSVNSISVARSRLRKKFGLGADENLICFLEVL